MYQCQVTYRILTLAGAMLCILCTVDGIFLVIGTAILGATLLSSRTIDTPDRRANVIFRATIGASTAAALTGCASVVIAIFRSGPAFVTWDYASNLLFATAIACFIVAAPIGLSVGIILRAANPADE